MKPSPTLPQKPLRVLRPPPQRTLVPSRSTCSRSRQPVSKRAAPFVRKLYDMVGNPETATLIAWSEEGRSFWIHDPDALEAMVLPRVFKHNRIAFFHAKTAEKLERRWPSKHLHERVFKTQKEPGGSIIALSSTPTTQLIINSARLMTLSTNHVQASSLTNVHLLLFQVAILVPDVLVELRGW